MLNIKKMFSISLLIMSCIYIDISPVDASAYPSQFYNRTDYPVIMWNPYNIPTLNTLYYTNEVNAAYSYVFTDPAVVKQKHQVHYAIDGDAGWWVTGMLNKTIVEVNGTIIKDYDYNYNWVHATGSYILPSAIYRYHRELFVNDLFTNPSSTYIKATNYAVMIFSTTWDPSVKPMQNSFVW